MDPLALLIIGGGLLAKHYANSQALERQQKLQGAMQAYQVQKAQQTRAAIEQSLEKQTPQARATELADITSSRANSMQSTLDAARAASPVTQVAGTNTSSDYQASQAAAADRVASRDKRMIAALATMGAPGEQAVASGIRFGRTAGTVDANNAAIGNVGNAYMRDINNVQPNPWLTLAGEVGTGVGAGMLANSFNGVNSVPAAQPNLLSPNNASWGSLDDGPGAYSVPAAKRSRLAWPKAWGG